MSGACSYASLKRHHPVDGYSRLAPLVPTNRQTNPNRRGSKDVTPPPAADPIRSRLQPHSILHSTIENGGSARGPKPGSHPGSVIRRCRQVPGGSSQRLDNNLTPEVYHTPQSPQVGRSGRQHPHATSAHDDAVPACETTLSLVSISRYLWQMVIMDWGGSLRPQPC